MQIDGDVTHLDHTGGREGALAVRIDTGSQNCTEDKPERRLKSKKVKSNSHSAPIVRHTCFTSGELKQGTPSLA